MAGWDVTVVVTDPTDVRAIRILGANTVELESALLAPHGPMPEWIAVSSDLYETDSRIREGMTEALSEGRIRFALWGEDSPSGIAHEFSPMQHRLSVAARAFKAHALTAASVPRDSLAATETFRSSGSHSALGLASVG